MRGLALGLVAFGLSACSFAQMQQVQQDATSAKSQYNVAWADCAQRYPDRLSRPAAPRVACLGQAIVAYHSALAATVGDPYVDLVQTMAAKAAEAAEQYDGGKKTQAQYLVALATINTDYQNEVLIRMKKGVSTAAQQQAAQAANAVGAPSCTALGNASPCF